MTWALPAAVVAVAAVVVVNVLLLGRTGTGTDPVGRLAPTVRIPAPAARPPAAVPVRAVRTEDD